ncbi:hypothetical protein [Blackfly microvirus SF02]|uniref:Uncharacterized protein n=1 Tax=Blackfly microvirus SF02 TaxID=2576452 RepID=A0A4P8PT00_9VIRU|nr:hypothetical protein [Blackfly microvirus SF02]
MKSTPASRFFVLTTEYVPSQGEQPVGVSMTEPGLGINLKELVERFILTGGVEEGITREGYYPDEDSDFDDDDLEAVNRMDIADRTEAVEAVLTRGNEAKEAYKASQSVKYESDKEEGKKPPKPKKSKPAPNDEVQEAE